MVSLLTYCTFSPVFVSDELPHYIKTMEADLLYYEEVKGIDPPLENKVRVEQDWALHSVKNNKKHRPKFVRKKSDAQAKYKSRRPSSLRQRIMKGGNLWQHKLKRLPEMKDNIFSQELPSYGDPLPSYQRFQYL